jgi:D-arabinose 1-dehydrogenase-like Zn-dependent alcohol dehydrogenase
MRHVRASQSPHLFRTARISTSITMTTTQALILEGEKQPFKQTTVLIDSKLQDQDVLVEFLATGICHTDIGVQKLGKFPGTFPRVLGHEGIAYGANLKLTV